MKSSLLILLLAVSACIVQTRAGLLDSFTGGDDDKKGEDEGLYQGGMAKQAMHSLVDVALDRALAELKEKNDIPMGDTVILLVTEKVKEKIHEAINNYGKKNEEEGDEQREENNEEGGFSSMLSRRKRDVTAQQKPKRGGLMGWIKRKVMRNKGAETVEGGMDHVKHEEKFEEVNDKAASKDAYGEEDHSEVKTEEKATEEKVTEADKEEASEETSSESDETKEKGEKSVSHSDETSKADE